MDNLMVIDKNDYKSDRQSLVAQTERAQIKIGHLETELEQINDLYWDLLESFQDGVERELRNFVEHFNPTDKEKKLSNNIREIVSEIYDEYVTKGRELSGKPKGT